MIGPPIRDIELELETVQQPASVYCESLSPDSLNEEEELYFTIDTSCDCGTIVTLMVKATHQSLRRLQVLLLGDLRIVCTLCAHVVLDHGRR